MNLNLMNMLRGISGEFEINRVLGAFGATVFIVTVPAFEAWNMGAGRAFDVTAYCIAYPAGIAASVGAIAAAVRWKDKGVEEAKIIRDTGSAPGGPAPSGPQEVTVVNTPKEPVPTKDTK